MVARWRAGTCVAAQLRGGAPSRACRPSRASGGQPDQTLRVSVVCAEYCEKSQQWTGTTAKAVGSRRPPSAAALERQDTEKPEARYLTKRQSLMRRCVYRGSRVVRRLRIRHSLPPSPVCVAPRCFMAASDPYYLVREEIQESARVGAAIIRAASPDTPGAGEQGPGWL